MKFVPGEAGTGDKLYQCRKKPSDSYDWALMGDAGAAWVGVFSYKKPISISNSGSALTDYQVNVTLDTAGLISAGKMQSDCDDIRFTDADGTTPSSYWIESGCNSANTKILVKVSSVPSGSSAIYMYYGNPFAASASNGPNTFDFFDDFEGQIVGTEPAGWTILKGGGSYVQITDSTTVIISADGSSRATMYKNFTYPENYVFETRMYMPVQNTNGNPFNIEDSARGRRVYTWMERYHWYNSAGYLNIGSSGYTVGWDVWRNYKLVTIGNSSDVYIDGTFAFNMTIGGWDGTGSPWSGPTNRIAHDHYGYIEPGYYLLDYTRVRKYASPEPTTIVGTEKTFW